MAQRLPPRAELKVVDVQHLENDRCRVRVNLVRQLGASLRQTFVGEAEGAWSAAAELRCAGAATLQSVQRAYGADDGAFRILDVKTVQSFEEPAVIVAVSARYEGQDIRLVGFCEFGPNPPKAAAKAVLSALNRFLQFAYG